MLVFCDHNTVISSRGALLLHLTLCCLVFLSSKQLVFFPLLPAQGGYSGEGAKMHLLNVAETTEVQNPMVTGN